MEPAHRPRHGAPEPYDPNDGAGAWGPDPADSAYGRARPGAGFGDGRGPAYGEVVPERHQDSYPAAYPGAPYPGASDPASYPADAHPSGSYSAGVAQPTGSAYREALPGGDAHRPGRPGRNRTRALDRSKWHWLLFVPVVVALFPPLFNRIEPTFMGLPFYYWGQLGFALFTCVTIAFVHVATKSRRDA